MKKPYSKASKLTQETSIKKAVFELLDKNPLLSHRMIAKLLHIDYNYYKRYLYQIKHKWKYLPRKEQGSIPSSRHGWRGWTYLPKMVIGEKPRHMALRRLAVTIGAWIQSKSRNRFLLFKDRTLGRLQWFETGRVNVYARKPINRGRVFQLIANGFGHTELITDFKLLGEMLKGVKQKSQHYVFDIKQPLPQITIDLFGKSNGIVVKIGDRTHPTSIEIIAKYPDWAERNETMLDQMARALDLNSKQIEGFTKFMSQFTKPKKFPERDFVV